MAMILLVEDEQLLRWGMRRQLEQHGHVVAEAPTLGAAEAHLKDHRPDIVLLDLRLPDGNGLDFMAAQTQNLAESQVIVATASGQVDAAVRAMKLGAFDFLTKPVNEDELIALIGQALERQQERNAAERYRRQAESAGRLQVVAESAAMRAVLDLARTVAQSAAATVLIQGETGTGKEVLARYVHAHSTRSGGPLLAINCAALPEQLVESELFGHEKGAFTDAKAARKGLFELAQSGTLVLDEVGELPMTMQAKLLRVLEERSFRRVGGIREIFVDVRVLAVSNRDLAQAAAKGTFRPDLFHRLNVFPLQIPPLRQRRDDIVPLALAFVQQFAATAGKSFSGLAPELRERLVRYDWPGNVRELKNLMERASILEPGGLVTGRHLPGNALGDDSPEVSSHESGPILPLDQVEYQLIRRAMESCDGNQSAAARLLGVSRDQLRYRLKRYREEGRWEGSTDDE